MEPDQHKKPHIHISKGHNHHIASISLEGVFLKGENTLTAKEKRIIVQWVGDHRTKLLELWDCVKEKKIEYPARVMEINATWEYNGFVYSGQKPKKETCLNHIKVWYNGTLSERPLKDGSVLIECSDDICIYRSMSPETDKYLFSSVSNRLQSNYDEHS
jgi:hypothetical protein